MSDQWTRKSAAVLADAAMKVGLTPQEADTALEVGARFMAHGFTRGEIDAMILDHYYRRANEVQPVSKTATK
jgi:hypothetical protein